MTVRSALCLASLLASAPALAAIAPAPAQPVMFGAQSKVVVDATGAIVSVERPAKLPDAVADAIEAKIRTLRFEPPKVDGHPVGAATYVQMQACAVPNGGNYTLAIKYRGNGPGRDQEPPPRFPHAAMRSNISVSYRLIIDIQADGSAKLESLTRTEGGPRNSRDFEDALKDWVPQLRYLPEQVDARPVPTRMQRDVDFRSSGETYNGPAAMNRALARDQAQEQASRIAASDACQAAFAGDGDAASQSVALDSPLRLRTAE